MLPDLALGRGDGISFPVGRDQLVDVVIHAGRVDLGQSGGLSPGPLFTLELLEDGSGPQPERLFQCPQLVDCLVCIRHR